MDGNDSPKKSTIAWHRVRYVRRQFHKLLKIEAELNFIAVASNTEGFDNRGQLIWLLVFSCDVGVPHAFME